MSVKPFLFLECCIKSIHKKPEKAVFRLVLKIDRSEIRIGDVLARSDSRRPSPPEIGPVTSNLKFFSVAWLVIENFLLRVASSCA